MIEFQYTGLFWIDTEQVVGGTISYSAETGIRLFVMGPISGDLNKHIFSDRLAEYPIIFGVTDQGNEVTLVNSTLISFKTNSVGFTSQEFRVVLAFFGHHFQTTEELIFSKISVNYDHLTSWFRKSGFSWQIPMSASDDQEKPFVLSYIAPKEITFPLKEGLLTINHSLTTNLNPSKPSMTQGVSCFFEIDKAIYINDWLRQYILPVQHFFALAMNDKTSITTLVSYVDVNKSTDKDSPETKRVQVIFHPAEQTRGSRKEDLIDVLFTFEDINDDLYVIQNWLISYDELNPVVKRFFGLLYHPIKYMELSFSMIIQCLESYYRLRYRQSILKMDNISSLINESNIGFSQTYYKGIAEQIETIEPPLSERIDILLQSVEGNVDHIIRNRANFSNRVALTKRHINHHDKSDNPLVITGEDLYWSTQILVILMKTLLLKDIGISSEKRRTILSNSQPYKSIEINSTV